MQRSNGCGTAYLLFLFENGILNAELLERRLSKNYSNLPFTFDHLPWKLNPINSFPISAVEVVVVVVIYLFFLETHFLCTLIELFEKYCFPYKT
jgi:hypothetical protein